MPAFLRHLSLSADDMPRARAFYEQVMGWRFTPWGPPDFLQLSGAGVGGGLNLRHTVAGKVLPGLEPTFAVEDIVATMAAIGANGGTCLTPEFHIQTVGRGTTFQDPEGNIAKVMQYERVWSPLPVEGAARLRHFAINAEDLARAKGFYGRVFGWTFTPWGPPDFYQTRDAGQGLMGALQGRRGIGGHAMPGMEMTFAVEDIAATSATLAAAGGEVLMAPFHIEGVGHLSFFADTEGNVAGAMQYESVQWPE
jgi:uncharacterized protein